VAAIGKGRFPVRREESGKQLRINERIRITPVRLIDDKNEQLGIVEVDEAIRRAREAGLDLVEVAPQSRPPVCRIMDYGKWKYQQKKKEAKARAHSKHSELKEVRLRPGTEDHDIQIKTNHAKEFLADGHKVLFTIIFKGRQMAHREIGYALCQRIVKDFETIAHVEMDPKLMGKRMSMTMAPGAKTGKPLAVPAGPAKPAVAALSSGLGIPASVVTAPAASAPAAAGSPQPTASK
jgi:translation initiation factor IF-3